VREAQWADGREVSFDHYPTPGAADGADALADITLLQTGGNLGFAGGNNVGLRFALARGARYCWLLNTDTVVAPDALAALLRRVENDPGAGLCGSRLVYADPGDTIQAWGGARYSRWTGATRLLGNGAALHDPAPQDWVERTMSYVVGASMLVRREWLERVGLMQEDYFLYFEELDWARRARGLFRLAYAHDSIVYHKEGGAIGSHRDPARKSALADRFAVRNRLRYTFRHDKLALPTIWLATLVAIANRIRRRQPERARQVARTLFSPSTYR
jgi:GT2 family glycosyltransferase